MITIPVLKLVKEDYKVVSVNSRFELRLMSGCYILSSTFCEDQYFVLLFSQSEHRTIGAEKVFIHV